MRFVRGVRADPRICDPMTSSPPTGPSYSTRFSCTPPGNQFDECEVDAVALVETHFDGAQPRRSDSLQTRSLASDT
jgi:hypothetical protein